ncbi:MAG: dihydroorotate dehydrogenase electron transfer subunit [Pirellulales bacterium]
MSETPGIAAAYYADRAVMERTHVVENVRLARDTYRVRIHCPTIARRILPGQFVMLRLAGWDDPLLGRPLALYDTVLDADGQPTGIDVVYLVLGKMTSRLSLFAPGQEVDIWGPLGNGFAVSQTEHLIMVAGGIGQTPFLAVGLESLSRKRYGEPAREPGNVKRVTLCYGVRTAELLAGADDFRTAGFDLRVSSDDGSVGHRGFVTDLLRDALAESNGESREVYCCGPEPMMEAVAEICRTANVACQVSLETPMACGVGICFSCVAQVRQPDGTWDYKRTCVDGPVFDAEKIAW